MDKIVELSPQQLRQLQLIELEMLVEVDRICRKNNINYSLDGGTLLGAIRHKGFIPWDDDADVIFTRHEYAKFYKACKRDLDTERFFLQEYRTDPNYRWGYAKIRRKGTEYIRSGQEHMKYVTGVCIDVFVTDNVPDGRIQRWFYYSLNVCLRKVLYSELGKYAAPALLLRVWYHILSQIPRDLVFRIRNIFAAAMNRRETELKSHLLFPYPESCRYGVPANCFHDYINIEFEGMFFQIMKEYDLYLRLLYDDYMILPPEEKRCGINSASKIKLLEINLADIQNRYNKENMLYI